VSEPVTIVGRVLAATADAVLIDDGRSRPVWLPSVLAPVKPMGPPLPRGRRPEMSETDFVEATLPADLALTLGVL
jgi:hypothetical protein